MHRIRIGSAHRLRRFLLHKHTRSVFGSLLVGSLIVGIVLTDVFKFELAQAATLTWTQTSWAGGLDGGTRPTNASNQSGWTKYDSKDSTVTAGATGIYTATSSSSGLAQTTATDFNLGTNSTTIVNGSGSAGSVGFSGAIPDMTSQFTFSENTGTSVADGTGNGNTGTLNGIASPATASSGWTSSGKIGTGLIFDGGDDYVSIPASQINYGTGQGGTISLWVKPAFASGDSTAHSLWSITNGNGSSIKGTRLANNTWQFGWTYTANTGAQMTFNDSLTPFASGTWHHLAFTWNDAGSNTGTTAVYFDGAQVASTTTMYSEAMTAFKLGGAGTSAGFAGTIDEARIYNRALTSTEVSRLFAANGEVVEYTFDEGSGTTANDASGNSNTGTLTNGATFTTGVVGQALVCDGTNDYVTAPDSASLDSITRDFTYSAWLYKTSSLNQMSVVTRSQYGDAAFRILLNGGTAGERVVQMQFAGVTLSSTATFPEATWTHMTVTYDGATTRLYINGTQTQTWTSASGNLTATNIPLYLCQGGSDALYFNGKQDEVRIFKRALSAAEVTMLYQNTTTGTYTSAVLDATTASPLTTISYTSSVPTYSALTVDVRAGNTATPDGTWTSWQTSVASGGSISGLGTNRYVQYRVNMTSSDGVTNPSLDSITISYTPASTTLTSSAYNSGDSSNVLSQIIWTAASSSEATVKFQFRTAPDSGGSPGTYTGWMGPDGTSGSYFVSPTGSETFPSTLRDGSSDQWFQYKAFFASTDSAQTAILSSVLVKYVVNAAPDFDANYPTASAGGVSGVQNSDGTATISYSVRDQDTSSGSANPGYITPSFEYSVDNGSTWSAISSGALAAAATSNKVVDQSSYTTYTVAWTATSSISNLFKPLTKVRVTANDNEGANNTASATSAAFTVDTAAPSVGTYTLNQASGTLSLAITDNSNITYRLSNNSDLSADGLNAISGQWQTVNASTTSQTINWTFANVSNPTVYLQAKDVFSNQTNRTGVVPQTPQNFEIQDVSSVTSSDFKEFVYWQAYSAASGAAFSSYKIYRSTDSGSTYSLYTTINDANYNYYLDSGLASSTTYYYKIQAIDSDGDSSAFTSAVSDLPNGQGGSDLAAPVISGVTASTTQSTWFTILWNTDELSDSVVQYSADPDVGFGSSKTVSTMVTSHVVTVTGLTPNTLYHYRVRSSDILDNASTDSNGGAGYTITTAGGPIISNVTTPSISDSIATISWDTNIDSSSIVKYADNALLSNLQTAGTGSLVGGPTSTTVYHHQVNLTGLTAGTTYYYYVESTDASSNTTTDNNGRSYYSFNTTEDVKAPVISNISTPVVAANTAVIVWQTDELSTSQVAYGTASTSLSTLTTLDSTPSIYHIVTLTGLTAQTDYFYAAHSVDQASNEGISSTQTVSTTQDYVVLVSSLTNAINNGGGGGVTRGDTTPPVLTNVKVKDIKGFQATVTWHTDEMSRSFVELRDELGKVVTIGSTELSGDPVIVLPNLRLGGQYSFVAKSFDAAGNLGVAPSQIFATRFVAEANEDLEQISDIADLQSKLSDIIESSLPSLLPPTISDISVSEVAETEAKISWKTNIKGSSLVGLATKGEYREEADKPYPVEQSGQEEAVKEHSVVVTGLTPNTLYHYQVRSKTLVGTLGKSLDRTFTTKAGKIKPFISGTTNSSFIVSWTTDAPATSIVEYKDVVTGAVNKKDTAAMVTKHEMLIENLPQGATYEVRVSGVNADDNVLSAEPVKVVIKRDVSMPVISNFKAESFVVPGRTDRIQTVVSWLTDEPATSIVDYSEGSLQDVNDLTSRYEDTKNLSLNHTVALLNLKPKTVYTMLITSVDKFGNKAKLGPRTLITPQEAQSILDVILGNFNDTFKFIKNINP